LCAFIDELFSAQLVLFFSQNKQKMKECPLLQLYQSNGHINGIVNQPTASNYLSIQGTGLQSGIYYLIVQQGETLSRNAVVKVE